MFSFITPYTCARCHGTEHWLHVSKPVPTAVDTTFDCTKPQCDPLCPGGPCARGHENRAKLDTPATCTTAPGWNAVRQGYRLYGKGTAFQPGAVVHVAGVSSLALLPCGARMGLQSSWPYTT